MCAAVMAGCLSASALAAAPAPEYRVKAVFLFQFAQFVEWPGVGSAPGAGLGSDAEISPEATPDIPPDISPGAAVAAAPFTICVLGEDPFHQYLDETVRGEAVKGRPLTVRRYQSAEEAENCSILFIARSEADRLESILGTLRGRSVLTVSDSSRFAERGGAIQFVTVRNKIKLRINAQAAKAAQLTISSKLLGLADIVAAEQG